MYSMEQYSKENCKRVPEAYASRDADPCFCNTQKRIVRKINQIIENKTDTNTQQYSKENCKYKFVKRNKAFFLHYIYAILKREL